jgi:plasmid segregation protein ParM
MDILSVAFPSVFEHTIGNTESSAKDLLNGLKIKKDETWYIVGNLAKKGGISPYKITNASPAEEDFDILFRAAMINLHDKVDQPMALTMGFPFSTYNVYKNAAEQYLKKRHFMVEYDTRTFNTNGVLKKAMYDLDTYEIIPEIVGCIIGLKKMLGDDAPANFMAVSLGFGTVEGGMASEDGLVHRTCFSAHGIQYAIDNLSKELNKNHYLNMQNVHQLDDAMMKASIFIDRKKIDLKDMRKSILRQYYKQIITPLLRKYFTNQDFEACEKVYLMGGGSLYPELVEAFREEFGDAIPVEVAPEPDKLASIGYLYNSYRISDKSHKRSVGLDIGNATTIVSSFQPAVVPVQKPAVSLPEKELLPSS